MNTEHTSPVEIEGEGERYEEGLFDTYYSFRFDCKYREGFTMVVTDDKKFDRGVRFEGTDGLIYVRSSTGYGSTYRSHEYMETEPRSLMKAVIGPNEIHLYRSDDHKRNFLDCIKTRSETVAPVEVAHRSVMIGYLGIIAMKLGRKLRWDPEKERFVNDPEADRHLSYSMRSPWHL